MRDGKNHEGYQDPTASAAVGNVSKKEKKRKKRKVKRSKQERREDIGKSG